MISLQKAHKDFIKDLEKKGRSPATILAYGKDIEQLVEFLSKEYKKTNPADVKPKELQAFMDKLSAGGYTNKSISRKTNSTKTFFRFLENQKVIQENPAAVLIHPKFETRPPRILSQVEYRALRDACRGDVRTTAIIELLLQTGIRIGELAAIQLEDITFGNNSKRGELFVRPQHKHEARIVPLNNSAQKAIKDYLEIRPKVNPKNKTLFITKTGNDLLIRNIRTVIDRYYKLAGIKNVKLNDLRHTFIAHHLSRGASLTMISRLVGHKRVFTTEHYLNYIERPKNETTELEEL